jgi:SAM-dependent methyltransferase
LLTAEEVIFAYRLFLGRDPENQTVVNNLCHTLHSVAQLRDAFIDSSEFRESIAKKLDLKTEVRMRHPFTNSLIPVQTEVSDDVLNQMFDRIQQEWLNLGNKEPYWSVLTKPEFNLDQFKENKDKFYASGDSFSYLFSSALRRNGINPNLIDTVLDVGCGVGRITVHLARSFNRVIGVDVSQAHLNIAKAYLQEADISNVELQHWADMRALYSLPKVDAVYSIITLQHNPPPVSAWMIKMLLNALRPNGVAYFQLPTYKSGYLFEVERYLNSPPSNHFEMHFLPQREIFKIIAESQCKVLEVREDPLVGDEEIMLSNTFLVQKHA